jgi:hypothetical protein
MDPLFTITNVVKKSKSIPVTGRGGPWICETSRLPHFPDNRLTDGGEVVSLKSRPPFTPRKIPGTHFCYRLSRPQGHRADGRIKSIEKKINHIGTQTRDFPACSIVPQPTTLPRVPGKCVSVYIWTEKHLPGSSAVSLQNYIVVLHETATFHHCCRKYRFCP